MLCTDLTLPAMIVLSGMVLTMGFPIAKIPENRLLVLVEISDSQIHKQFPPCPLCRSWNIRHKKEAREYLEPIIIKLKNVIGKYEEKKEDLEKFYFKFNQLTLPNERDSSVFGCLNFKQLKRKISELTKEMRKIKKNLRSLIFLEKSPNLKKHDNHEGRLHLLKEFRGEIKNLIEELRHNKKKRNKRRNKSLTRQMPRKASTNLSHVTSETKLKIAEWELLENLKTVLENWMKNLKNFSFCVFKS